MRIGTIFSGCGAPEQAAARVWQNHKVVFACEWDKFARQSYLANYGIDEAHFHKDVREMDGRQYKGKVDVLVWGFPCTSYSIAGLRKGMDDEKTGDLFHQGLRILKQCKPKYTIIENVKGLLSIDGGKTMELIMRDLREAGYFCHYEVINSKDYGIPQNRERVFIVGFLDHEDYYRFQFAPKQPLTKRLKDVLEPIVDEKYYLSEKAVKGFQIHAERMAERGNGFKFEPTDGNTIASSVTTRAGGRPDDNFVKVIGKLDIKGDDYIKRIYDDEGISPCLPTMQGGSQESKILQKSPEWRTDGTLREYTEYAPAIRAEMGDNLPMVQEPKIVAMRGRNPVNPKSRESGIETVQMLEPNENGVSNALTTVQKDNLLDDGYRIRKLTPLECWRLQDFPDEAHEKAKAAGVSDSRRYQQAGNSMTVAVVEMIFRQIDRALKGEHCAKQGSLF